MPEYHVVWEINLTADSPVQAAKLARQCQEPGTAAVIFNVTDKDGNSQLVDLLEEEDDE